MLSGSVFEQDGWNKLTNIKHELEQPCFLWHEGGCFITQAHSLL